MVHKHVKQTKKIIRLYWNLNTTGSKTTVYPICLNEIFGDLKVNTHPNFTSSTLLPAHLVVRDMQNILSNYN